MIRRMMQPREEDGVALVMALAFLSLFGILITVLLSFADTSFRATGAVRAQINNNYATEGATQGAINYIRGDLTSGRDPAVGSCPGSGSMPSFAFNGVSTTVACTGQSGSGVGIGPNVYNTPSNAVLTLGQNASEGINSTGSFAVGVAGSLYSNSKITGTIAATGSVSAHSTCGAGVTTLAPPRKCSNDAGGPAAIAADPAYSKATSTVPTYQTVPACSASRATPVHFSPGYYDDATALNALTNGACGGRVIIFDPTSANAGGVYYFNFKNSGTHTWTVSDNGMDIIGGTLKGIWTGAGAPPAHEDPPTTTWAYPGRCKTDTDTVTYGTNGGVQFIFGGDSQFAINDGLVELCAQALLSAQQIAIYGLTSGTPASTGPVSALSTTASGVSNFATSANATGAADGSVSTGSCNAAGCTAVMTLSGYSGIPTGSQVTAASVQLTHRDQTLVTSLSARITNGLGTVCATQTTGGTAGFSLHTASLTTDTFTPPANCIDSGSNAAAKVNGATVLITATRTAGGAMTELLDSVVLRITYVTPQWEVQSGTPVTTVPCNAASCAFVSAVSGKMGLITEGSLYAPLTGVYFQEKNKSYVSISRGLICRTMEISKVPPVGAESSAGLPTLVPPSDRVVDFVTSIGGVPKLRATVKFVDGAGATPGLTVTVLSWVLLR